MIGDEARLAEMARGGAVIVTTAQYKRLMLELQGSYFWNGRLFHLKGKAVGAGLYNVTAKEKA